MSWELKVISTSPVLTPAFAAGDPGSTLLTTGYESKNALKFSSIMALSDIVTPNQPVGGSGIGGGCAPVIAGSPTEAIKADATSGDRNAARIFELLIPRIAAEQPAAPPSS